MRQLRGVLAALLPLVPLTAPAGAAAGPVPPPGSAHQGATARPFSVTLVTGYRVSARSATGDGLSVQPAAGRERVTFSVEQVGGSVFVVPSDARALVSSGTVDRRLFDVAGLIRDGYHDEARPTVPLIVTAQGAGVAQRARGIVTGSEITVTARQTIIRATGSGGDPWRRTRGVTRRR